MTMIDDDYRPGDEFDWDQSRDDQHCQHGTFIGSWWGPDLMCQWCEDGISVAEMRAYYRRERERRADTALGIAWVILEVLPPTGANLTWWVKYAPVLIQQYGVTDADLERWERHA
jgi:hypothetical protein